jgi:ribonuclease R
MLPEVLSNDLCSLNPHQDRFAFSAVFIMDINGNIDERWFGKTVINSNHRFSYESAQESLDTKGEYFKELDILNTIAKKLQHANYHKGAIDFETEEVKFKLDEHGKPLGVYKKARLDTHKLVEEYMLLANREVAEFIYKFQKNKADRASLYRIHDLPDEDRIEDLALFLKALGYHLPVKQGKVTSQDINNLLKTIEGKPEESLIKTATIRSMAKAIYSPQNIGHFGLGFEYYTHFTSPIRRYPDLMVHRILQDILTNNKKKVKDEFSQLQKIASHATEKEIAAAEAERASIKYKQVEYMSAHIGEEFDGVISGVTEWGIFVEDINTKCEGLVALRELNDDYYVFNKKTYSVQGEKTRKTYRLGDKVRFKVTKADLDAKTLDYSFV